MSLLNKSNDKGRRPSLVKWIKKKSAWPAFCALGCLFLLAVLAPQAWKQYQVNLSPSVEADFVIVPSETTTTLPVELQAESPVVEQIPAEEPAEFVVEPELAIVQDELEVKQSENVVVLEATEPTEQLPVLTLPPAPPEPTLAKPEIDLEVLLKMRDTLMAMVNRLPSPPPLKKPEVEKPAPQVRVQNESDRLAMLDRREPASTWNEHSWAAPEMPDTLAGMPLGGGIVDEILDGLKQPQPEPAQIPLLANNKIEPLVEPTTPTPTLAPQLTQESKLIPLPPVEEPEQVAEYQR